MNRGSVFGQLDGGVVLGHPERECIQDSVYPTRAEARRAIFRWINWYNQTGLSLPPRPRLTNRVGTALPASFINPCPPDREMPN